MSSTPINANPSSQTLVRRLEGKIVVITGASKGIGAATAIRFAREGAKVVLAARDEAGLNAVAQEIAVLGGEALAVPTDVSDAGAVENLIKRTVEHFGRLDIAFNNAGSGGRPTPLADMPVEGFDNSIAVNLRGVFLAMKYEIPAMLASGGGAIVNMASTAGLQGVLGMGSYAAAKHAVIGLTKSAALDYAQQNIRVNVVAPGPIVNERIAGLPEEARQHISNAVPMRRLGDADEVAATVAWLCSGESAFITGTVISIDGGRIAGYA